MAIIRDCELHHPRLDPNRPNSKYNKKFPTWEIQIRTCDRAEKKVWEDMGLPVKAIVPDEGEPYFRVNLKKKSIKEDGSPGSPVNVVDGNLQPLDGRTIGNGSRGNVRVFQYPFTREDGSKGVASVLMGVQVTKHIVFEAKSYDDDFEQADMEVIRRETQENGASESGGTQVDSELDDEIGF